MSTIVKTVLSHQVLEGSQFPQFQKEIERLIESGGKILMLDFSNIIFLKNSELMAVVAIMKLVRDSGCILLISAMSEQVRMLFELTGLEQIFQCLPPPEEVPFTGDLTEPLEGLQSVAN
ncbi:MAG: anti-sigma factor antagonist [Oscillatoriales cyanobacterium]|uniref:STAS domain-containing protein n=1 Tax=Microcoleus sp. PH2017_05_CCC_O_A TaxID=2798816 RepID=UPI001DADE636|nr:STAS domain-containing protein [Microcoleus sp. PH2017_05_CCC_O_A]MCC3436870.1 STAS domain-containing protein [Microcoleus sp. PH2017_05_CCC_O_A]TAF97752.1 MAG: anti-sigma factor antagonist [Oscillatoriales cyanobacterium]TAG18007.1 MAG: anti-sigma factor antagonist [Oscillatoriales cyanobacterium]TAG57633.1 MAG: anti-sigma factor antagonist [Oscillatoriales cyanobacterium]